jgi:hypothetical protein
MCQVSPSNTGQGSLTSSISEGWKSGNWFEAMLMLIFILRQPWNHPITIAFSAIRSDLLRI